MWRRWPVGRVEHLADGGVRYEPGHQLRLGERPRGSEPRAIPEILRRPSRAFRRERDLMLYLLAGIA